MNEASTKCDNLMYNYQQFVILVLNSFIITKYYLSFFGKMYGFRSPLDEVSSSFYIPALKKK